MDRYLFSRIPDYTIELTESNPWPNLRLFIMHFFHLTVEEFEQMLVSENALPLTSYFFLLTYCPLLHAPAWREKTPTKKD